MISPSLVFNKIMAEEEYEVDSCVRGYHVYKSIWDATVGERLTCVRDPGNQIDRYAVAVNQESGTTVGHLPKKISKLYSLFLRRGGSIEVVVSGRRYSSDLQLEVPCKLLFRASSSKEMDKLKKLSSNH